jgi:hypothetical protein
MVSARGVRRVTHGVRGRSQRAVRVSSMVAVCVEEIRAVLLWHAVSEPYAWPESGTRVVGGGGGIDVVYGRGSGSIGIFVVLRRHTRPQMHTRGHRAVHAVPWGALGASSDTRGRTRDGEGCTRRAGGRSEQRATDASKNIGVFCGYTLVSGLSRGYTCVCGQRVAHVAVGFAARCEKGTALAVARRLDFDRLKG